MFFFRVVYTCVYIHIIYIYIYIYLTGYAHCRRPLSRCRNIGCAGGLGEGLWAECLNCMLGFWGYFSVFWNHFLMISGSNLGGLPPPEHLWDLLAAAGGSPMLQSVIFNGFWLPSWVPLGTLFGYFLEKGSLFCNQFCRSLLERLRAGFSLQKVMEQHVFSGILDMLQT